MTMTHDIAMLLGLTALTYLLAVGRVYGVYGRHGRQSGHIQAASQADSEETGPAVADQVQYRVGGLHFPVRWSFTALHGKVYRLYSRQLIVTLLARVVMTCVLHSYLMQEGVCYLTLADRGFPKRLAFLYLEEVHVGFVEELERDSGSNWRDVITTAARPYAFIKFGESIGHGLRQLESATRWCSV